MEWSKLLTYEKFPSDKGTLSLTRTPFQEDYDRIIFSEPFRRLAGKTQVHPLKENDHVHSRLPHSLEVSSVGRSLGSIVAERLISEGKLQPYEGVSADAMIMMVGQIVQTACLAHDIGNPPFGHAGETIIQNWFKDEKNSHILSELTDDQLNDFKNFEGNAQALRILTELTMRKSDGGIRASYSVLATMMKYPWQYSTDLKKSKFCAFKNEREHLKLIAEKCGMTAKSEYSFCRHPLAYLSEAADDICYNIMDLEDAYELKILSYDEIASILIKICEGADYFDPKPYIGANDKNRLAHLRALATYQCILAVVEQFFEKYDQIMSGKLSYSYNLLENSKADVSEPMLQAKDLSTKKVFTTATKQNLEEYADEAITFLLNTFMNAVHIHINGLEKSEATNHILNLMGDDLPPASAEPYQAYLKVTDFISGMTDKFAVTTSVELSSYLY